MRTGKLHKTTGTYPGAYGHATQFNEWRIFINFEGYIRCTFRKVRPYRSSKWTTPFDADIKKEIIFDNPEDMKQFDEEFKILFERQREKHPLAHKEQKSDAIKHINEVKKRWPKSISDPASVEHVNYILKICRKRTTAKQ
jgi:hypothetical protein